MADVYYNGTVQAVAKVMRVTVGTATAGETYSVTVTGPGKVASYTAVTGDDAAAITSGLVAAMVGSLDGEIRELTAAVLASDATKFDVTGPADGAPFTITVAATGSGTISVATPVAAKSPHDAADVANYSSGALPANGDRLIIQTGANGPKYGLTAITAVTLTDFIRYRTHTGPIGLPSVNPNGGYPEYRTRFFEVNATNFYIEQAATDQPEQINIRSTKGTASAFVLSGQGGGFQPTDTPIVQIYGAAASSTLDGSGASVGYAMAQAQTGALLTTRLTNGLLRVGPGATVGALVLKDVAAEIAATYVTLNVDGASEVEVTANAGSSTTGAAGTVIDGGAVRWRSKGVPGDEITVGTGGTFDAKTAPDPIAAFKLNIHEGGTVDDSYGRVASGGVLNLVNCGLHQVSILTQSSRQMTW